MNKLLYFLAAIIFISCEDVVEIDLNESAPKLVIEATMHRNLADSASTSFVKLTTTAPFFENVIPEVTTATVTITDENGISYDFVYTQNGMYEGTIFIEDNVAYTLEVLYEGETYSATESIEKVAPLEFVEQNDDGGFSGDEIELKAFFTDPAGVENYYFFEGLSNRGNVYDTFYDEFFDGNPIFGFYVVEDLEAGDEVNFQLSGVDEQFYNFMLILLQQGSDDSGGPFETQPATVRGNIVNLTDQQNFPLGYFRISEISTLSYTVQ